MKEKCAQNISADLWIFGELLNPVAAAPAIWAVPPRYPPAPEPEPGPAPVPSPSIGARLGQISHNCPQTFAREAYTRRRTSS